MRVVFYGSCWPTNIGNAFVNLGALATLRAAVGERGEVAHIGGMSSYLSRRQGRPENDFHLGDWIDADYVVMGGMTQSVEHLRSAEPNLRGFLDRGARIVIAGGGAERYDDAEVAAVREILRDLPIHAFASRDTYSFERYRDCATHAHDGVDSAFFVGRAVDPLRFVDRPYVALCFDSMAEPPLRNAQEPAQVGAAGGAGWRRPNLRTRLRRLLRGSAPAYTPPAIDADGLHVVRAHHATLPEPMDAFTRPATLISDLPSDHLSLYANARVTYTDRIHACIAALALGGRAQLFGAAVPRLRMFERVGAGDVLECPVALDAARMKDEWESQVDFLRNALFGSRDV
jgi:hypothetical protein